MNYNLLNETLPQTQIVAGCTRHSPTCASMIDLLITSTPQIFPRAGVLKTALSDHRPIYGVIPNLLYRQPHRIITTRRWSEDSVL